MKKCWTYALKSEKDGRLYKGLTNDIKRRIKEHNNGKVKATKGYMPWRLFYLKEFDTLKEAREHEKYLKSGQGREFLKKLIS